jgi:predicted secreted protein
VFREKRLPAKTILVLLFAAQSVLLSAGDVAVFEDLGFSEDGRIYMFAQYGVRENSLLPWAELRIVNVRANDFVPNGILTYTHNEHINPGQDGSGALYKLISANSGLIRRYAVPFLHQGLPLFVTLLNASAPDGDSISFRDFEKSYYYTAKVVPYNEGHGASLRSSFFIELSRRGADGTIKRFVAGSPEIKRNGVESYSIKKVLSAPDSKAMIFVIELRMQNGNVRYMVEALKF